MRSQQCPSNYDPEPMECTTTEDELYIARRIATVDSTGKRIRMEIPSELRIPMPGLNAMDSGFGIGGTRKDAGPCPRAIQTEAFLIGLKIGLPSIREAEEQRSKAANLTRELGQADQASNEYIRTMNERGRQRDELMRYVFALEQRLENEGLRLRKAERTAKPDWLDEFRIEEEG